MVPHRGAAVSAPELHARMWCVHGGCRSAIVSGAWVAPGGAVWSFELACCADCASDPVEAVRLAILMVDRLDPQLFASPQEDARGHSPL